MLNTETIKKIEEFVYAKPRNMQEIAKHIKKSWRTADRYVKEIEKEHGTISTRTFRKGTRGALKVVYWSSVEKVSSSIFQEKLEKEIKTLKNKQDFSPFDIYQHIQNNKKEAWIKQGKDEVALGRLKEFKKLLLKTKKQILFFSGNLSFINYKDKKTNVFKVLDKLVKKGVSIKVLCRTDITAIKNIEKLLSLNFKHGKDLIEIRHCEQPLRATIIDKSLANLKQIEKPTGRTHELNEKTFIFYTIKDKEWIDWLSKIFWNMFSKSVDAKKRIRELKKLK